ncbi:carbohydrate ABC transporter permease [Peloplasma aerotolerans]|uniref:Carbohydrate ABC transporter permease n=1 Tax=Peloplasma aerotolerans TaxID=3044389 RepID=A0AAW6UAT4_9MOLU|nr:carbohydrate ABC transporter permease [Mariniplasma sp. M4Ah]MDI6452769.1 carbohydrate ABC transporter permease [Mariniplasma sp. M4Ah]
MNQIKWKKRLFGMYGNDGLLNKIILYILFIGIGFIFLYPLMQMLVTSFMPLIDLVDPTTIWIPKNFTFRNYIRAIEALNASKALIDSIVVSILPTIFIVISSAMIGYGFASYDFPLKKLMMSILLMIFLIPTILMAIPTYVIYRELQILDSLKAFIYPAMTGFGFRQTIFILIFYQFFKMIPKELKEAAEVDGASAVKVFIQIAIPLALPAFLITSLYAFVWYWNETSLALLYFPNKYSTLPMAVIGFRTLYENLYPSGTIGLEGASETFNQGVQFAGTILSILPLLIVYFIAQKWFIEGVDRSGIAGN